jgi:hypothetical protein
MAMFTIAEFTEGKVRCTTWAYPTAGSKVGLTSDGGNLLVSIYGEGEVSYTWPRDPNPHDDNKPFTVHDQARLAIRHYERKTGRDAFNGNAL